MERISTDITTIILCGGRGVRFGLENFPKWMMPIDHTTLLENHIYFHKNHGALLVGIRKQFSNFIDDRFKDVFIIPVESDSTKYGATALYVSQKKPELTNDFVVFVMGDHFIDYSNLGSFYDEFLSKLKKHDLVLFADSKPIIAKPESHSKIKIQDGKITNGKNLDEWQYLDMGIIGINKRLLKKMQSEDFDTSDLVKISTNPSLVDVEGKVLWFGCNTPDEYAYGTISLFMLKRYGKIFTPKTH